MKFAETSAASIIILHYDAVTRPISIRVLNVWHILPVCSKINFIDFLIMMLLQSLVLLLLQLGVVQQTIVEEETFTKFPLHNIYFMTFIYIYTCI